MHYANGRPEQATWCVAMATTIKHEIIGVLVYANPGSNACNCQVVTVTKNANIESATTDRGEVYIKPRYETSLSAFDAGRVIKNRIRAIGCFRSY